MTKMKFQKGNIPWNKGKKGIHLYLIPKVDSKKAIELYESGLTLKNTAKELGVGWKVLFNHFEKIGYKRRSTSELLKGRKRPPFSKEWKENIRKGAKGKRLYNRKSPPLFSEKHRAKMRENMIKRWQVPEYRKHMISTHIGDKNWCWKGGISNNPYPINFNSELKLKIRQRDNFTCCLCDRTEREELEEFNRVLCVNHIDFNKNNCEENNLNTLCLRCNVKINRERDYWTNYFNNHYDKNN